MKNEIISERLRLLRPSSDNLEEMYKLMSNPEVNLYNPSGPDKSIAETKERLELWIKDDWEKNGIGYYMIRELLSNEYVGYAGVALRTFKNIDILNMAYRINPKFHRKGYVIEACREIISDVKKKYPEKIIRILTKKENIPSFELGKKLGFIYNSEFDDYPERGDVNLFDIDLNMSSTRII